LLGSAALLIAAKYE